MKTFDETIEMRALIRGNKPFEKQDEWTKGFIAACNAILEGAEY